MSWKIDPVATAISDCNTAVAEGANAADMAQPGQLGADEALINAMGTDWVLDAAGVDLATNTDEHAWERIGVPWCQAYNAGFRARAAELATK